MPSTRMLRPSRLLTQLAPRSFSTSLARRHAPADAAADAAHRMLENHGQTTIVRRQLIDANQLAKLAFTLGRPSVSGVAVSDSSVLPAGTPVPPGYHLVYFTPGGVESDLGPDGTDRSFNAPAPFSRRMWAGGSMKWKGSLLVGDEVEERTRLVSATPKTSKTTGAGMVLVEVEKELWSPRGLAVVDRRSWIFRPAVTADDLAKAQPPPFVSSADSTTTMSDSGSASGLIRRFNWSPVGLFRFSALTFNGHKIHYNDDWTHRVESHAGLVVHGPLNLINLLNYWQDAHGQGGRAPKRIKYRAVSPIYAGQEYQLRTKAAATDGGETTWDVVAEKNGKACMVAEIQ